MPTTLQSSRNAQFAPCFCTTQQNHVIVVDGINKGKIWNGVDSAPFDLGIAAPTAAATVTTPVGGGASAGTYVLYYRFKDADGNYSSLSPVASVTALANDQFSWDTIPASSNTRVTHKELLRSLVNDTATLYLVTTITNATTSYTSDTGTDAALAANTAHSIDNADGTENLDRFDPPPLKRFALPYLDRTLYFGDVAYEIGSVELTNGAATVQGRMTNWTDQAAGLKFYVDGQTTEYEVSSLNTSTQVITLTANYGGSTDLFSAYSLRANKNQRRRIYYTSVLEPESVRDLDYVLPADEGEDYTGGYALRNYAFVCEPMRTWKVFMTSLQGRASVANKPGLGLLHAFSRGLVNHRCHAKIDDLNFCLDARGLYVTDGQTAEPISDPVQDYFRDLKINMGSKEWFFVTVDPTAELLRIHVSLGEGYLANHALLYHYRRQQWQGEEEYQWNMGAGVLCDVGGQLRVLYGGEFGKFYLREGTLDGTTERTIRGTATAATALTLTDDSSDAAIPSSPVGAPLALVAGRGKGQVRRIVAYASSVFTVDRPWLEHPDTTTEYQVGGIVWNYKTGQFQIPSFSPDNEKKEFVVVAEPTTEQCTFDVRRYMDQETTAKKFSQTEDIGNGVVLTKDSADAVFDIQKKRTLSGVLKEQTSSGRRHKRLWGFLSDRSDQGRFLQLELRGVQGMDRVRVYSIDLEGMVQQ